MNTTASYQTLNLTVPHADVSFLRTLSKKMGWNIRAERKSGIEKGLDDIRKGKLYHAKNSEDLLKQILG
ncbi:MAG: hypothetical protein K6A93_08485 [Bacteroidaceae bacterium]|jgi:hypothetical protein|nr:hypothetical protein [Bacteroidaceae bacterium]MCR5044153.1 hypothetical protein [Bacteroidaceae bacterium]MDO4201552.1 hypothetical protein [Bacteroidales bacterium]